MILGKKAKAEDIIKEIEKRVKRYATRLELPYIELEVDLEKGYYKIGLPKNCDGKKRERLNQLLENDPFLTELHLGSARYVEK